MKWLFSLLFWVFGIQAGPQTIETTTPPSQQFGINIENIRTTQPVSHRDLKVTRRIGTHIVIFEDTHFREKGDL